MDGGYAEYLLVPHERYLVPIKTIGFEEASSLACSGLTAYHAAEMASPGKDEAVVLIGMGGVGLMGIQWMKRLTDATLVAVDIRQENLDEAKKLGAHVIVNPLTDNLVEALKRNTGSSTIPTVIDFVNSTQTAEQSLAILRKGGKLIFVGLFGGHLTLTLPMIPLRAIELLGCLTGNLQQLKTVVSFAEKDPIKSVVARKFPFENAREALALLRDGKITGRSVLCP